MLNRNNTYTKIGIFMNIFKIAGTKTFTKQTLDGRFGPFEAYVVSGDTYPIRAALSTMGFSWMGSQKVWYIPESKYSSSLIPQLRNVGVDTEGVSKTHVPNFPQNPNNPNNPIAPERETSRPTMKQWVTEDEDLTKWYKFPINKNIMSYEEEVTLDGEKHKEKIVIDRNCQLSEEGSTYSKPKKSREHVGIPIYVVHVGAIPDKKDTSKIIPIVTTKLKSAKKWGEYNEEEYLKELRDIIKIKIENNPPQKFVNKSHGALRWHYDILKRTPELINVLEQICDSRVGETSSYKTNTTVKINNTENTEYNGEYPITLKGYAHDGVDKLIDIYVSTNIDMPGAPTNATLGSIKLFKVYTEEDLNKKIEELAHNEEVKKTYLKYLQSFPFLSSQQDKAKQDFNVISQYMANPEGSYSQVLNKIKDIGYIRPHKRQKQSVGLSSGDEIKWVIDSEKIKNDVYGHGPLNNTPEYFYVAVSYYIHREIRNIWSYSQAMLTDSVSRWVSNMKEFGADIKRDEAMRIIEKIGMLIINQIYPDYGSSQEDKRKSFYEDFNSGDWSNTGRDEPRQSRPTSSNYLEQFKAMASEYGIDTTNAENNLKGIYRQLVSKVHPDKFLDPQQKIEMTKKFQDLQNIWDELVVMYKVAFTWYENYQLKHS